MSFNCYESLAIITYITNNHHARWSLLPSSNATTTNHGHCDLPINMYLSTHQDLATC